MTLKNARYVYKETRLHLEPPSPSCNITFHVQPSSLRTGLSAARLFSVAQGSKSIADDERDFQDKNIATASGVYHRKASDSFPRSFLWRILGQNTVLSIRVIDMCRERDDPNAINTLNLHFPTAIRPSCVGFVDSDAHNKLSLFVIDQNDVLCDFVIRPVIFTRKNSPDAGVADIIHFNQHSPSHFGIKKPHRLVAATPDQVVVTTIDGGILRFDRSRHHTVTGEEVLWKETIYNAVGWRQSLLGMLPFQSAHTIKYENHVMELNAATSIIVSSFGFANTSYLFSVCLDHQLRVWDVRTGQILYSGDILSVKRNPQDISRWIIDPSQTNLIRLMEVSRGQVIVATFSPVGFGEFKFWKVQANESASIHVVDLFPNHKLIPPTSPTTETWSLADFSVAPDGEGLELWTLWKNNLSYRVRRCFAQAQNTDSSLEASWQDVHAGVSMTTHTRMTPSAYSSDPTDQWLAHIFYPGRFSRSMVKTAIDIFAKASGINLESTKGSKSLAESVCLVLSSSTMLERASDGLTMSFDQFRQTGDNLWRRFHRLLLDLDKRRTEALSLVLDPDTRMTWVVCADSLSVIRQCSKLDLIYHNLTTPEKRTARLAALITAGLVLTSRVPDVSWHRINACLQAELGQDSTKVDEERLRDFADKSEFWRVLNDEDCNSVAGLLGKGFKNVDADVYNDLFDTISAVKELLGRDPRVPFSQLGHQLVLHTVQDTVELTYQILLSQIVLLAHVVMETDEFDDQLARRLDVGFVYRRILAAVQRLEHVKWLSQTELTVAAPSSKTDRQTTTSSMADSPDQFVSWSYKIETATTTAFGEIVGHLLGVIDPKNQNLRATLTQVATNMCAPDSDIELSPSVHQCYLLKRERPDLAAQLGRFCAQEPFPTYVQGRVALALHDSDTAAHHFKKAAFNLSLPTRKVDHYSCGLVDDTEWAYFNTGLANYYAHIVNIFARQKDFSYVVEFARLSLQFVHSYSDGADQLKTDVLSRLFGAATQLSLFDQAHSALLMMPNAALQRSAVKRLVEKMCGTGYSRELIALPFPGLQDQVDRILLNKCKTTKELLCHTPPYHQILYAWRISHHDHRGAAAVLLDHLRRLQQAGDDQLGAGSDDSLDTHIARQFLLLLNCLSCASPDYQWIVENPSDWQTTKTNPTTTTSPASPFTYSQNQSSLPQVSFTSLSTSFGAPTTTSTSSPPKHVGQKLDLRGILAVLTDNPAADTGYRLPADTEFEDRIVRGAAAVGREDTGARRVVTLAGLRKEYQIELDRIVAIQNNRFEFGATGEGEGEGNRDEVMGGA